MVEIGETLLKDNSFFDRLKNTTIPILLLINKIDKSDQKGVENAINHWRAKLPNAKIIPVSALEGFAIDKGLHIMRKEYGNLHEKTKKELQVRDGEEIPFRFIRSPIYGTRCTTVFMSEPSGLINISEVTYQKEGIEGTRVDFSFNVKD